MADFRQFSRPIRPPAIHKPVDARRKMASRGENGMNVLPRRTNVLIAAILIALGVNGAAWAQTLPAASSSIPAAAPLPAAAPASASASAPAVVFDPGIKVGQTLKIGSRSAVVRLVDTLPYVDNEFTRCYTFDKYGNPKLNRIRVENCLDDVVATGRDELEKQLLLMAWAHSQVKYGDPVDNGKLRNAQTILDLSKKEQKLYCSQFSALMVSAAASMGWVYRLVGIPSHSFGEIWSNQHRRWIYMDPTNNWYVEKDSQPQDAYQIRKEWYQNKNKNHVFLSGKDRLRAEGTNFDSYYVLIYNMNTALMDGGLGENLIVKDQWSGGKGPTQNIVPNPAVELYFAINQAALSFSPEATGLKVKMRTLTPNFQTFRLRVDNGAWADSGDSISWPLHAGLNSLEARSVNLFGVEGAVSRAEVEALAEGASPEAKIVVPARAFSAEGGGRVRVSPQDNEMLPSYIHLWFTPGHWLEWKIAAPEAGEYDLSLTYGAMYDARRGLSINRRPPAGAETIDLVPTGDWRNFSRKSTPVKVALQKGENVIRLACQDDASVCLNELRLSSGRPGGKDIVIEAINTSAEGGGKAERIYAAREGFFRLWSEKGHALEYVADAPEAGEYQIYLRYAAMYPARRELRVNGEIAPGLENFTLPVNSGWQEWVEAPLPAKTTLKAGRNVLRFTSLDQGVNMCDIRLSRPGKADIFIGAADFSKQEGGKVMNYQRSRHGFVYAWGTKGQWVEWTFDAPADGEYQASLLHANERTAVREVRVNGQVVAGLDKFAMESTGGGQTWQETPLPVKIRLSRGANTLRLTNVSGSLSLDEIVFTPEKK
jgi:hypothetical protein